MRVSTAGQSFDLQRDAIAKAGCERVYDDTRHGRMRRGPYLGPPFRCYPEAVLAAAETDEARIEGIEPEIDALPTQARRRVLAAWSVWLRPPGLNARTTPTRSGVITPQVCTLSTLSGISGYGKTGR